MVQRPPLVLRSDGTTGQLPTTDVLPPTTVALTPTVQSSAYTAASGDLVLANAAGGAFTITLPSAGIVEVKKTDQTPNAITVAAPSGTTIGTLAAATIPVRMPDQSSVFRSNGSNFIVGGGHLSLSALDNRYRMPLAYDDFTAKANGTLSGTLSNSGHTWITSNANGADPVVLNGTMGPPSGYSPTTSTSAGYGYLQLPTTVSWVGCQFRFDASDSVSTGITMGAFTQTGITATTGGANMHLGIYPHRVDFSVFSAGAAPGDFTPLVPEGYETSAPRFPFGMWCDGITNYRADVIIDQGRGKAYVMIADFPTLVYSHPFIRTVSTTYAFWEYYSQVTGVSNFPRITRVWADTIAAAGQPPQTTQLAIAASRTGPASAGAGPGAAPAAVTTGATSPAGGRPPSRMRQGSTYWDSTLNAITISDGTAWRNTSNVIVGNRLGQDAATAMETSGGMVAGSNVSLARARAPITTWRVSSAYKITATAAANGSIYTNLSTTEVGTSFFVGVAQVLAGTNPRSMTLSMEFYNSSNAIIGSATTTAAQTVGLTTPVAFLTSAVAAPTNTAFVLIRLNITSMASGDVFYATDFTIGSGTTPGHLRS